MAGRGALDPDRQRAAAAQIEGTARDLGQALTGIVWSLGKGGRTLRDLCVHVSERGADLFPAEAPAFVTALPVELPPDELPLLARRNLQLILVEALHNAAKHAQASRVVLGAAVDEHQCRLWVEDDGVGLADEPPSGTGGHGRPGMAQRAADIGAALTIGRAQQGPSGTRVEVTLAWRRFESRRPWLRPAVQTREAWPTSRS
jgi:glucose-6-phosphate-specific signal transduction histidine kinase